MGCTSSCQECPPAIPAAGKDNNPYFPCTTCKPAYYVDANIVDCNACPTGCDTCTSDTQCQTCSTSYGFSGSTLCSKCSSSQYTDASNYKCTSCPTGCKTCTSSSTCQTCETELGYGLINGSTLCQKCPSDYTFDASTNSCKQNKQPEQSGLSGGQIAGITVGAAAGGTIVISAVGYVLVKVAKVHTPLIKLVKKIFIKSGPQPPLSSVTTPPTVSGNVTAAPNQV